MSRRENARKGMRRHCVQTTLRSIAAQRNVVQLVRKGSRDFIYLFRKMGEVATCLLMAIIHKDGKFDGKGEED